MHNCKGARELDDRLFRLIDPCALGIELIHPVNPPLFEYPRKESRHVGRETGSVSGSGTKTQYMLEQ